VDARVPNAPYGLIRRTAVDSRGPGNSPEKRKVGSSILPLTTSLPQAEQSLQEQGGLDDQAVLDAAGARVMLTIDAKALLDPPRPFTDDELTGLIAKVVDDLDARVLDLSVSTYRSDSGVQVEVSMTVDTDDPREAQAAALAALRDAFDAAVPAVAGITRGLVFQEALAS